MKYVPVFIHFANPRGFRAYQSNNFHCQYFDITQTGISTNLRQAQIHCHNQKPMLGTYLIIFQPNCSPMTRTFPIIGSPYHIGHGFIVDNRNGYYYRAHSF